MIVNKKLRKISIIIPVYNEEAFIDILLKKIVNSNTANLKKEIIVIDDNSQDSTVKKILNFTKRNKMNLFLLKKRKLFMLCSTF